MNNDRNKTVSIQKLWPYIAFALVLCVFGIGCFWREFAMGRKAGANLGEFLVEMASILPPMFVLIGLFEVWIPRGIIERHLGIGAGGASLLWMVLLATMQAGPLYAAFPVATSLWRKGCAPRNVFIYLGAFSAMKIPMLTFEIGFLGWSFSLARTIISLPVFIIIGFALERLLSKDFTLPSKA